MAAFLDRWKWPSDSVLNIPWSNVLRGRQIARGRGMELGMEPFNRAALIDESSDLKIRATKVGCPLGYGEVHSEGGMVPVFTSIIVLDQSAYPPAI